MLGARDSDPATGPLSTTAAIVDVACWVAGGLLLPALAGAVWRRPVAFLAVSAAFAAALGVTDVLTYGTLRHHCNDPQPDACDPGPVPASFLLILLPVVVAATAVGRAPGALARRRASRRPFPP
jgi:hypothetical protein